MLKSFDNDKVLINPFVKFMQFNLFDYTLILCISKNFTAIEKWSFMILMLLNNELF